VISGFRERGRAHQEVAAEDRFVHLGHVFPAVPAGEGMGTEIRRPGETMDDLVASGADALVGRQPQAVSHRPVHPDNAMLFIQKGDQVRDRVEGPFPFFSGPEDGLLALLQFTFHFNDRYPGIRDHGFLLKRYLFGVDRRDGFGGYSPGRNGPPGPRRSERGTP